MQNLILGPFSAEAERVVLAGRADRTSDGDTRFGQGRYSTCFWDCGRGGIARLDN